MSLNGVPPLLGDGKGCYRVHIVGNSGTGKSTTGEALAKLLGVPFISLDTLHWEPGWKYTSPEGLQAKLRQVLDRSPEGWVVDGSYLSKIGSIIEDECTDIIWLDPPLALYFPRIFIRTMLRLLGLRPPCSPGCPERLREVFFSKESILWWCLTHHLPTRRTYTKRMAKMGIIDGEIIPNRKMRRLGGWGHDLRQWMDEVSLMCRLWKS